MSSFLHHQYLYYLMIARIGVQETQQLVRALAKIYLLPHIFDKMFNLL
jgi:hypothetical protein